MWLVWSFVFKESASNLHSHFTKIFFPLVTNLFAFGCFTTLCKILAPHVTHINLGLLPERLSASVFYYLPCGVNV